MLISANERERQILKIAFEQQNINVVLATPTYASFLKVLQYLPDAVVIEIPREATDHLHFASMVRKHKSSKSVPIIGYGDHVGEGVRKGIQLKGVRSYYPRPLKFTQLIKEVELIAKQKSKILAEPREPSSKEKDIQIILSTETLPTAKVEIMVRHVAGLLAFPFTVAKILQMSESTKSGASDLARAIEADPVIATNVLKVSNTVFFASLNRKINSIKDAIVRIGFRETKRIVMGMTVMKLFDQENRNMGFDRMAFWHHSLACAVIAEHIARRAGAVSTEEAFLAGLLHDLGIVILDEYFPQIFVKILDKTSADGAQFIDSEVALLGVHHNDVVKTLFVKWRIPDNITEGITGQYSIDAFKAGADTPGKKLALCVALGDSLAKALHLGRECDLFVRHIDNWVFKEVKLLTGFTPEFIDGIQRDIVMYQRFLGLDQRKDSESGEDKTGGETPRVCFSNLANDIFVPPVLYLRREGFEVEPVSVPVNTASNFYDMSMVWTGHDTSPDVVRSFSEIIKSTNRDAAAAAGAVQFAPVVAVIPEGSKLPDHADLKHVTFIRRGFDLRRLQVAFMQPSNGQGG